MSGENKNQGCRVTGEGCGNTGCWFAASGGIFIAIIAVVALLAQGAWETGEIHAREPVVQEVRETATEAAPSALGLLAIGGFFVVLAVVAGKVMFGFRE